MDSEDGMEIDTETPLDDLMNTLKDELIELTYILMVARRWPSWPLRPLYGKLNSISHATRLEDSWQSDSLDVRLRNLGVNVAFVHDSSKELITLVIRAKDLHIEYERAAGPPAPRKEMRDTWASMKKIVAALKWHTDLYQRLDDTHPFSNENYRLNIKRECWGLTEDRLEDFQKQAGGSRSGGRRGLEEKLFEEEIPVAPKYREKAKEESEDKAGEMRE
ncbi:hypothetical protein BJY04DRAFT_219013 [Aspergillus karnatakaensis]|uniref:uncharacterized protein n=1 Tax=Aspergillus karnatakaensis TaxID=1810916 RepID=UPI003CCDCF22